MSHSRYPDKLRLDQARGRAKPRRAGAGRRPALNVPAGPERRVARAANFMPCVRCPTKKRNPKRAQEMLTSLTALQRRASIT